MLSTEGTAVPGIKATGVFAGHLWGDSSIVVTNCFFGACGTTENAGTASEKTEEEFRNGTVAGLLGEAFAQVGDYPKINGPADYSSVDAAIAKANALIKDDYKDFSSVESAINSVVQGKTLAEQAEVDAMAKAIEDAIAALQYKDADKTTPAPAATATPAPAATTTPAPAATATPQYTIPQTGDTSNPALLVVLMLVSGSAAIGTAVVASKKKHNR